MAADEKDVGAPPEEVPEVLPTGAEEAAPKKRTMLIAVIVVAILIIAAIGIAWMAGVFGKPTTENQPPTVTTSASTHAAGVGEDITFTSNSTDPDGSIVSTVWDFGNGHTTTGSNVTYNYSDPGVYIVYVVVTDNGGATGDNEAILNSMIITVSGPAPTDLSASHDWNATGAPFLVLAANATIIQANATVAFDSQMRLGHGKEYGRPKPGSRT